MELNKENMKKIRWLIAFSVLLYLGVQNLDVVLACGICRDVSREEAHQLVDEIYDRYTKRDIEARED